MGGYMLKFTLSIVSLLCILMQFGCQSQSPRVVSLDVNRQLVFRMRDFRLQHFWVLDPEGKYEHFVTESDRGASKVETGTWSIGEDRRLILSASHLGGDIVSPPLAIPSINCNEDLAELKRIGQKLDQLLGKLNGHIAPADPENHIPLSELTSTHLITVWDLPKDQLANRKGITHTELEDLRKRIKVFLSSPESRAPRASTVEYKGRIFLLWKNRYGWRSRNLRFATTELSNSSSGEEFFVTVLLGRKDAKAFLHRTFSIER